MNATELIGLNIQNLRQSRRWSQERLAAEAGIDRSYVSLIEHGQSSPTAKKLEQIAEALGVSIKELHNERGVNVPTSHEQRLEAEPVAKLICPKTGVKMGDF